MGGGELPGFLVNEIGGIHGILHGHVAFLKKHFYLITMKEFLENRKHISKKVQAIYLWWHKPVIDQELLQSLPNLKVIANSGVGMDHLDLKLIASFGVKMANAPRAVSSSTADTGMALLLAAARRLVEGYHIAISSGMEYCEADFLGVEVTGATLGIIGMGSIGYKIALRAKAFEMNILYHNRTWRKEKEEQAVGTTYCKKIDNLLQRADFVTVVVSLTPETHKLIGKREMELMKPTATLINISRGAVVDQEALVTTLQTGVIRAAALDVTYPEPLPRDHTLLKLKNVIITPHLGIKTDKATYMIIEEAVENILAALNGLPISSEVLPS
ncbi:probable 2-ketogluconate reductase [Gymnogyps californianus]|uniref:probable 2-ketogluconate reductase n=1 Tax=Gymnogyps californianus TaxID=33616 RepID=UPI0021C882D4|nr:probable 2-ketogluconate reductase [Gymnogyps californianus]